MMASPPGQHDPITRALRALLVPEGGAAADEGEDEETRAPAVVVETASTCNAVVRTLRIPWCDGHLEWKLLQDLAAPFEDAFDVVFDDPDFAPDYPPDDELLPPAQQAAAAAPAPAAAVALVAALLRRYRARQFELLAALPDERLQLELALLAPIMDEEEEEEAKRRQKQQQTGGAGRPPPPRLPRLQLRLVRQRRAAGGGGGGGGGGAASSSSAAAASNSTARACFSVPLEGVKRASLGPLADYLGAPRGKAGQEEGGGDASRDDGDDGDDDDDGEAAGANNADADESPATPIRGLALRASFDVRTNASVPPPAAQNLRLSLAGPAWLRRAGLPPLALPPLPPSAAARPPLADYASDAAGRLAAHLAAQAPRAAKRYALVDALATVLGAAPLEVAAPDGAALATAPPGADGTAGGGGGGGGLAGARGGWSAVVARGAAAASSSSSSSPLLTALFALMLDGQPLLLAVEMGARFPDDPPLLRVTRALGGAAGAAASSSSATAGAAAASGGRGGGNKRGAGNRSASAELAEAGEAAIAGCPWSPRWAADEAAARIYNHVAAALLAA